MPIDCIGQTFVGIQSISKLAIPNYKYIGLSHYVVFIQASP